MKKLFLLLAVAGVMVACGDDKKKEAEDQAKNAMEQGKEIMQQGMDMASQFNK